MRSRDFHCVLNRTTNNMYLKNVNNLLFKWIEHIIFTPCRNLPHFQIIPTRCVLHMLIVLLSNDFMCNTLFAYVPCSNSPDIPYDMARFPVGFSPTYTAAVVASFHKSPSFAWLVWHACHFLGSLIRDVNFIWIVFFFSRLQSPLATPLSSSLSRKPSNASETKRRDSKSDAREPFRL